MTPNAYLSRLSYKCDLSIIDVHYFYFQQIYGTADWLKPMFLWVVNRSECYDRTAFGCAVRYLNIEIAKSSAIIQKSLSHEYVL